MSRIAALAVRLRRVLLAGERDSGPLPRTVSIIATAVLDAAPLAGLSTAFLPGSVRFLPASVTVAAQATERRIGWDITRGRVPGLALPL